MVYEDGVPISFVLSQLETKLQLGSRQGLACQRTRRVLITCFGEKLGQTTCSCGCGP